MSRYIALICFSFLLASCDSLRQEVDPSLITSEPEKLVVACFISPQDTMLVAEVTRSQPVLGENVGYNLRVPNATITLSDGSRSLVFQKIVSKTPDQYYYGADPKNLPIVAGRTYTLTVQVPDGRRVVGQCTVPSAINPASMIIDSVQTIRNGRVNREFFVRLRWQDPVSETNYYRTAGTFNYLPKTTNPGSPTPGWQQTLIAFGRNGENRGLTDDRGNNGQQLSSGRGFFTPDYSGQLSLNLLKGMLESAYFSLYLLHTDVNYYRYHEAVLRQNRTGGNPFAEPVLIPSNIEGGLGCFGAFNRTSLEITLK